MATIIRIKRSTGTTAPSDLKTGEIAYSAGGGVYNNGGDRLYFGKGDDGSGNATSIVSIGGEYYANLFSTTDAAGTVSASKAVVVDANITTLFLAVMQQPPTLEHNLNRPLATGVSVRLRPLSWTSLASIQAIA